MELAAAAFAFLGGRRIRLIVRAHELLDDVDGGGVDGTATFDACIEGGVVHDARAEFGCAHAGLGQKFVYALLQALAEGAGRRIVIWHRDLFTMEGKALASQS